MTKTKNSISIRNRTMIVSIVCLMFFILFIYLYYISFVLPNFLKLESDQVVRNINRIEISLKNINSNQATKLTDWAYWDDTYQFIKDKNQKYIDSNLTEDALSLLKINTMVFLNDKNEIVYSKFIDLENGESIPNENLLTAITSKIEAIKKIDDKNNNNIIKIPEGDIVISAHPILKSDKSGPSRGTLIFGSFLNDKTINDIGKIVGFPVSIYPYDKYIDESDVAIAKNNLSDTNKIFLHIIPNMNIVHGFVEIYDINNIPIDVVKVELPRDIYNQGQKTAFSFMILITVSLIIFFLLSIFLLDKFILRRLVSLGNGVRDISNNGDFSKAVEEGVNDEIGSLASSINKMFEKITTSNKREKDFDKQTELVNEKIKSHINEIEKLNKLMVGRELKMIELKKENLRLKGEENN